MRRPILIPLLTSLLIQPIAHADTQDQWCAAIGKRLASVSGDDCRKADLHPAEVRTRHGHPLMALERPPQPKKLASTAALASRPSRVMVIGGIHGDELTSVSVVFRWMQRLNDADAQNYHWLVIPLANPDGLLSNPPQRTNANGVDLNRNFPTPGWSEEAPAYWKKQTGADPRRFPGKHAMSEVETVWLRDQIEHFRPDVIFSVHAPFGILDYDGPARQPKRFGTLNLNRLGVYPGSLGNYGGIFRQLPVVTIELPSATAMPSMREQMDIWSDMLLWLRRNIASRSAS